MALVWQDQRAQQGWVTIKGNAELRPGSSKSYPVDIVVHAKKIEFVSYNEGLLGDDGTGKVPFLLVRTKAGWMWG